MRYSWKRMLAAAMAMLLLALPVAGATEADFDAGTLFDTLYEETYADGRLIETTLRVKIDPSEGPSAEQIGLIQKVLELVELRVAVLDDIDQQYTSMTLVMDGDPIVQALIKTDDSGSYLVSEQLPGVTLSLPGGMAPAVQNSADMAALEEAYIDYFAIVAAWVSQKQVDREDLYVYEPVETEESEIRDAAALEMRCRVRPDDLKELLRMLADQFYNDEVTQQAVANLLGAQGITRTDVRRVADQLPLWVSHELIPTGDATEFTFSYDDDMNIVGFDGKMPALYDKYPFRYGDLTYDRKTELEGIVHRAKGNMTLSNGNSILGGLQAFIGDLFENARKDEYTLSLEFVSAETDVVTTLDTVVQNQYLAADSLDIFDGQGKFDLTTRRGDSEARQHGEYTVHSETQMVGDLDFACDTTVQIDVTDRLSMTLECAVVSKEALPPEFPENGKIIDLNNVGPEEQAELAKLFEAAAMPLMFKVMGKLPPELMQQLAQ